jgi:1,4-dihydroxy-2-naphthoyl-CoA hydrolase
MTTDQIDPRRAARLDVTMGIEILEASPERVVATMPVAGNTQPFGLLHGGATCVLAETVGSIAATLHAGEGRLAVGVDINTTHHRAMRTGMVTGVATPLHRGRSVACYEVAVTDDEGRRVATARLTCQLVDAPGISHETLATPTRPS